MKSLCSVIENGDDGKFISTNAGGHTTNVVDNVSTESMTAPVRQDDGDVKEASLGKVSEYNNARITLDVLGITLNEDDRNTFAQKDRMSLMDEVTVIERSGDRALTAKSETITITDEAKNLIYELQIAARVQKARSRMDLTATTIWSEHRTITSPRAQCASTAASTQSPGKRPSLWRPSP